MVRFIFNLSILALVHLCYLLIQTFLWTFAKLTFHLTDEVRSAISKGQQQPATIQLRATDQVMRPNTGVGLFSRSSQSGTLGAPHQHHSRQHQRTTQSVKRSRNTLNAHTTLDSTTMTIDKADPRFQMYNKELIKGALDKRRARRAQSN